MRQLIHELPAFVRTTGAAVVATTVIAAAPCFAASEADKSQMFDVLEYRVLGNTILPALEIEKVIYAHLGSAKTIESVEIVRQALEGLYKERGFGTVFVDIPEQDVANGVVRLRVTEGKLARVRISGARYFSNGQIRNSVPALAPGSIPDLPALQAQLAKINRQSPDRVVTPVLRAGRTPGTVDVELKVQDSLPIHANVEVNDRYTADTSQTRVSTNLSYNNLFQRFHSLSLQYQTAPEEPQEARVWAATYVAPLGSSGDMLAVYGVDTDSEVSTIGTLAVLGKGRIYGARYIKPLPESGGFFHNMTFGGDFKDFKEDVLLPDDPGLQTPIQYASWSAVYAGNIRTQHTLSSFSFGPNFGIRGVGNNPEEFENKRFRAKPNYFYLRGNASHERPLLWGTSVALRMAGQFTVEPLISNEQFSIGGADSVRGYLESEELGDYGASGSVELRSPQLTRWFGDWVQQFFFFGFFDAGVISIIDPLPETDDRPGQVAKVDLSSWGVGLRIAGFGGLEAGLDWAYPLESTDNVGAGDSRIHFSVRYGF